MHSFLVSVGVFCAILDCALGLSPVTSYPGVKVHPAILNFSTCKRGHLSTGISVVDTAGSVGSGFPRRGESDSEYATHPWNVNNFPKHDGEHASLLKNVDEAIQGVIVPWLYIGMLFSCLLYTSPSPRD